MSRFSDYWALQCGNPRGIVGSMVTRAMNRTNKVMYDGIIENMRSARDMKVLDIGFGNGYLDALIYRKEPCTIYGIDISEDMVKLASERNKEGIENGDIHFALGDCCDLAFEDQTFDIAVTMNTIYFWNDTIKGLQEIYRVLKDGGVFYNAVLTKENLDKLFYTKNGFKKFEKHEYSEMGQQIGFKKTFIKNLENYGLLITYEK